MPGHPQQGTARRFFPRHGRRVRRRLAMCLAYHPHRIAPPIRGRIKIFPPYGGTPSPESFLKVPIHLRTVCRKPCKTGGLPDCSRFRKSFSYSHRAQASPMTPPHFSPAAAQQDSVLPFLRHILHKVRQGACGASAGTVIKAYLQNPVFPIMRNQRS